MGGVSGGGVSPLGGRRRTLTSRHALRRDSASSPPTGPGAPQSTPPHGLLGGRGRARWTTLTTRAAERQRQAEAERAGRRSQQGLLRGRARWTTLTTRRGSDRHQGNDEGDSTWMQEDANIKFSRYC
ncbi:unnamed protein product [Arctogadus glacialis]